MRTSLIWMVVLSSAVVSLLAASAQAQTVGAETGSAVARSLRSRLPLPANILGVTRSGIAMTNWQAGGAQSTPPPAPAPAASPQGSRSKGKIALGLGLLGGGLALMIANPDVSEVGITGNGQLYRKSYRVRLIGGVFAGGGGIILWDGLRRRH